MNWPALILAAVAVVIFVCAYLAVARKWASVALGLAFLTAAWIVELVFVGLHQVTVH